MARQMWKPGNMLYPIPAVMVSCADKLGNTNIITVAWTGNICSDPPMVYISVRPERYSHYMISEIGEFVINLTTRDTVWKTDAAGVKSGKDIDKWKELGLTPIKANKVSVPLIKESPLNIECKVTQIIKLGTHDMFIAEVVAVDADDSYIDKNGKFDLKATDLVAYSHGEYFALGQTLGKFGYSVRKNNNSSKKTKN